METLPHRLYRHWISWKTLIGFFFASFRYWPLDAWRRFWFTREGALPLHPDAPRIGIRMDSFREKVIDGHMIFSCITERQYEPAGFAINAGDTVVDIGAHIGSFVLSAAARGARVIACEPSPRNFKMLTENIAQNNISSVTALPVCIAGENGERTLFLDERNAARNGLYGTGAGVSVHALTLVELFNRHNIAQCDFLKMDCEGAEYEIFEKTSPEILARIERIAMEYHLPPFFGLTPERASFSALVYMFESAGFSVRLVPENRLRGLLFATRAKQ